MGWSGGSVRKLIELTRTIHGAYGAEARELRTVIAELKAKTKRLCEAV